MIYRAVLSSRRDPDDCRRSLYLLDCGHVVSRRTAHVGKTHCVCGYCEAGVPDPAQEIEMTIEAIRTRGVALDAGEYALADVIAAAMMGNYIHDYR